LIKDKVVIITGGAKGIGRVLSVKFAEAGSRVIIAGRDEEAGEQIVGDIIKNGYEAIFIRTDISVELDTQSMIKKIIEKYRRVDVLINNATSMGYEKLQEPSNVISTRDRGAFPGDKKLHKPFDQISTEEWDYVMAVNLRGMWLCCKAVVPYMRSQKKGKIINTSSSSWDTGHPFILHYTTTKAAIVGFTRCLAVELGEYNINANCVSYGPVFNERNLLVIPKNEQKRIVLQQAIKKPPFPEELVGTVMFLASDESDFVTGQTIHPNGGCYFH
jgi:3-oxoacyl-[acyl-carrier protein] reductase